MDGAPIVVGMDFNCWDCPNLKYEELFKLIDGNGDCIVKGVIQYNAMNGPLDKNKLIADAIIHRNLQHDELGNLDI